jgi:hypothetical protein
MLTGVVFGVVHHTCIVCNISIPAGKISGRQNKSTALSE